MGAWSGRGIPPTRRKLHRLRKQRIREAAAEARADKAAFRRLDRKDRKATAVFKGIDPESTLRLIGEDQ